MKVGLRGRSPPGAANTRQGTILERAALQPRAGHCAILDITARDGVAVANGGCAGVGLGKLLLSKGHTAVCLKFGNTYFCTVKSEAK